MKLISYDPSRYTAESVKFVNEWILGCSWDPCTIIGCRDKKDGREEDLIFYKGSDNGIRVSCLPRPHSKGKGWEGKPCFYGDLRHFIKVKYNNIHPHKSIWYRRDHYDKIRDNVLATFERLV